MRERRPAPKIVIVNPEAFEEAQERFIEFLVEMYKESLINNANKKG